MQNEVKPQMQVQQASDGEGAMARADLYRAAKNAMKLFQMVQEGQELEGWVQAKITKSADYLDSVYHYMEYQMKFGGGGQASSVDDITGEAGIVSANTVSEEDDEKPIDMEESMNYEQRLKALLEGAKQKAMMKKKPAKKDEQVEEGFPTVDSAKADAEKSKGTQKFDKKELRPGVTQYTRKSSTFDDGGDDTDTKKAKQKAKKVKEAAAGSMLNKVRGKMAASGAGAAAVKKTGDAARARINQMATGKKTSEVKEASKPDFLDMDDDNDKKEPMKKAIADKKAGPKKGVNPFAKKTEGIVSAVKSAVGLGKKAPMTTAQKNAAAHAANKGKNMPSSGNAADDYDYSTGRDKVLGGEKKVKESVTESADLTRMKQFLTRLNG